MLFIVNPTAARGRGRRVWEAARRQLEARGVAFVARLTAQPGDATRLTGEALRAGERVIVALGGDGTLSEVVNGWFDEAGRAIRPEAALGLVPCGTGSDFRRTLGIADPRAALDAICAGKTAPLDVVRVALRDPAGRPVSRYAINLVSFGLGGDSVALVNAWRETWPRWIGGHARFVLAALQGLRNYRNRPVEVRLDDGPPFTIQSNFLVAANGCYAGGGMLFAPHARPDDGRLDVVLTDGAGRWEIVRELPGLRSGAYLANPRVSEHRAASLDIRGDDPLAIDIDGEAAGRTPARLTVLPAALRFLVP